MVKGRKGEKGKKKKKRKGKGEKIRKSETEALPRPLAGKSREEGEGRSAGFFGSALADRFLE